MCSVHKSETIHGAQKYACETLTFTENSQKFAVVFQKKIPQKVSKFTSFLFIGKKECN